MRCSGQALLPPLSIWCGWREKSLFGDTVRVDVVIDGPTTDLDYYSFAFDLLLSDPTVARYVPGTAVVGDALALGAGQGFAVEVSQQGDRVIIGVTKTGSGDGNQIGSGEHLVLRSRVRCARCGYDRFELRGFADEPAEPDEPTRGSG